MEDRQLPFVQNHSENNSKIIFLCICIWCDPQIISEGIFICYAAPPLSCEEQLSLHLLRQNKSKIIFVCICICCEMPNYFKNKFSLSVMPFGRTVQHTNELRRKSL